MENLRLVLNGLDLGFEHVAMARIYLTRFKEDYPAMNETYRSISHSIGYQPAPASASRGLPTTR